MQETRLKAKVQRFVQAFHVYLLVTNWKECINNPVTKWIYINLWDSQQIFSATNTTTIYQIHAHTLNE